MSTLLNIILVLPVAGAVLILLLPRRSATIRRVALAISLATFALSLGLLLHFDQATPDMQFTTDHAWIQSLTIRYAVGVDGISLFLILLVTFLTVLCV